MSVQYNIEAPTFAEAIKNGEVVNKDSYHQPDNYPRHMESCDCEKTTKKGAYRDVTVEMPDGRMVYFYHQTPIVVRKGGRYRLTTGGHQTKSTKERINRHTPSGWNVFQRDFDWYLKNPDGEVREFKDGMTTLL